MREIINQCLPAYTVDEKIGKGVYGSVFRVHDAFKQRAVKVVPITVERSLACSTEAKLDSRVSQDFHAVREYYEKIKGPGVVEVHDFFLVDKQVAKGSARAFLVILMQFCRSNLLDFVIDHHPLPVDAARQLMGSLATVLNRLAIEVGDSFLLTDLKPSNLLLSADQQVLIGDLGGLKRLSSASTSAGAQFSPNWSSPEFILQGARPDIPAAVFSFGMVSYFILEGHLPYEEADFAGRIRQIKSDGITFSRRDLPDNMRYIIEQCVQFDARLRPGNFTEILEVLETGEMPDKPVRVSRSIGNRGDLSYEDPQKEPDAGTRSSQASVREPYRPGQLWREPVAGIEFVWVPGRVPDGFASQNRSMAGFWMGRYPVTQGQWKKVMGINPAHFALGSNYPVERVAWGDALDFARRLAGLNKNRYLFCLPTESQWEHAARWDGDSAPRVDKLAWHKGNSGLSTQPVGRKASTGLGIYDLLGNVMEWCGEDSAAQIYRPHRRHGSAYDEVGRKQAGRGGSWESAPEECRPDFRKLFPRQLGYASLGFRLVRCK